MAGLRELLAAVLGIALGIVFVVFPSFVVQVHTLGRGRRDRYGEWGSGEIASKWLWIVRAVGGLAILAGLYFGYTALIV